MLAKSLYHIGDYKKAQNQALFLLKHQGSDRLYILLAMINENLGEFELAKHYYLQLIDQYPSSDYVISAKIKSRTLTQY